MLGTAVAGLLLGGALGLVDGLRAPSMAGESISARIAGVAGLDGAAGAAFGGLLGLAWMLVAAARRVPAPRSSRVGTFASATLLLGVGGIAALGGGASTGTLRLEAARAARLEQQAPLLHDDDPRSVLLVTLDTVRADALAHMPFLLARAATAQRFESARANSPWTLPSLATIHTGLPYPAHGAAQMQATWAGSARTGLDPTVPTLAEALVRRGFVNLAVTTNPFNGQRYGFHRGFDRFHDLSRRALRHHALRRATLLRPLVPSLPERGDVVTDKALEMLPRVAGGRFFLWLHYLDAHAPYSADPGGFDPLGACELPTCFDAWSSVRQGTLSLDAAERDRVRGLYETDLAWLDGQLERLFAGLEAAGVLDRMLVVVVGDHGEAFWEPGDDVPEVEHGGSFRDVIVRVPLLAWVPGRAGADRAAAVDLTTLRPAILDWVDTGHLGPLDSDQDLVSPLGSLLFADDGEGCTDGRVKVVRARGELRAWDLAADPREERPTRDAPAHLVRCLDDTRARVGRGVPGDMGALRALGYAE